MKKALLLMLAAFATSSSYAQIDTFYNSPAGLSNGQIDTLPLLNYYAQYGNGYLAGMNDGTDATHTITPSEQVMGAAEAYNPVYNVAKSYKIIGMLSAWGGSINTTGSESLTFHVWSVDNTSLDAAGVGGADSVAGFPGTSLNSAPAKFSDIFPTLNAPHGNILVGTVKRYYTAFPTATEVNTPFFVGYTFDNTYTYGSPADTLGVLGNVTPAGSFAPYPGHDNYVINKGSYNLYQSRNCVLKNNIWVDLYWQYGFAEFLAMTPVVELDPLSVSGVSKGGLTFFGAYPNPSINNTNIKFSLTNSADVTVDIMDMSGHLLNSIQQKGLGTGEHVVALSTANLASGNYLYTVTTNHGESVGSKLSVIK